MTIYSKRSTESLWNIVLECVCPESNNISDYCKCDKDLNLLRFKNLKISNSYNFIDPVIRNIYPQNFEFIWILINNGISHITRVHLKKDYLIKYLFFKNNGLNTNE
ncbi:hypothetical protein H312_03308 [Anncaliia algerae PRA339]|uniref:Uncharacterized protein n=1 Tax=Anncaliia algerae PRA339 TaxID=1288291 RepID=A0A059EW84_9MICR|nr:hypothetical protein H312_03308 [Anncaliia algerae PRA339]